MSKTLEERVAELEAKVAELGAGKSTVKAPFKIVDEEGEVLLHVSKGVEQTSLMLLSPGTPGRAVITVTETGGGKAFLVGPDAALFIQDTLGRPKGGLFITPNQDGQLRITNADGEAVAMVGSHSETKKGVILVLEGDEPVAGVVVGPQGEGILFQSPPLPPIPHRSDD